VKQKLKLKILHSRGLVEPGAIKYLGPDWKLALIYLFFFTTTSGLLRKLELAGDSQNYLPPAPIFSSQTPGVTTNLFFAIFGATQFLIVAQSLVSALSWLILAFSIRKLFPKIKGKIFTILILLYSLSGPILSWNSWALTESLTLSVFVMWIGVTLLVMSAPNANRGAQIVALSLACSFLVILTRPLLFIVIIPVQIYVIISCQAFIKRKFLALFAIPLLILSVSWGTMRLTNLSNSENLRLWYAQNNLVAKPRYADFLLDKGISCPPLIDAIKKGVNFDEIRGELAELCQADVELLSQKENSWIFWVVERPGNALEEFFGYLKHAKLVNYSSQQNPLPSVWNELLTPTSSSALSVTLFFVAGSSCFVNLKRRLRKQKIGMLLVVAGFSLLYLFVSWAGDGMEMDRHLMPILSLFPLFGILMPHLLFVSRSDVVDK
jgi:hypothetical protein